MQRELNPSLFGTFETREGASSDMRTIVRQMEAKFRELAQQARESLNVVRDMNAKLEESNRTHTSRMDRLAQAIARIEQFQTQTHQEFNEKHASLASRVNERRMTDTKIENLVDRHNHIVQSFEARLKQMQKTIADREMQMLKMMALLEDSRAELARMKKT